VRVTLLAPAALEFIEAVELVSENPGVGAPHRHDTRRVLLNRFPYAVVYRPLTDRVMVVAVAHLRRRPVYWAERL